MKLACCIAVSRATLNPQPLNRNPKPRPTVVNPNPKSETSLQRATRRCRLLRRRIHGGRYGYCEEVKSGSATLSPPRLGYCSLSLSLSLSLSRSLSLSLQVRVAHPMRSSCRERTRNLDEDLSLFWPWGRRDAKGGLGAAQPGAFTFLVGVLLSLSPALSLALSFSLYLSISLSPHPLFRFLSLSLSQSAILARRSHLHAWGVFLSHTHTPPSLGCCSLSRSTFKRSDRVDLYTRVE